MFGSSLRQAGARLVGGACLALAAVATMPAHAAGFPEKPVRLVVPFPPGGPTDTSARLFSKVMAEKLGQPVIVENRSGAGGSVGTSSVKREAADGYTLLWGGTSSMVVAPALYPHLDYDPVKSFTPIGMAVRGPLILVSRPELPAQDLASLIDLAGKQKLAVASAGTGSVGHLTAELFKRSAGVDILHVPYRGGAPALSDVLGGQVDLLFDTVSLLYPQVTAGKLRAYAVTGAQRYARLPDVPTVAEVLGKPFEAYSWFGLMAPAGTPEAAVKRLTEALAAAAQDPVIKQQLGELGLEAVGDTPEEFARAIRLDLDKWTQIVKQAGIKPD